jgi:hypothetical protein
MKVSYENMVLTLDVCFETRRYFFLDKGCIGRAFDNAPLLLQDVLMIVFCVPALITFFGLLASSACRALSLTLACLHLEARWSTTDAA